MYSSQHGSEFVGMRDLYSLLKLLRDVSEITPASVTRAVCRCFGGHNQAIIDAFLSTCFPELPEDVCRQLVPRADELIRINLEVCPPLSVHRPTDELSLTTIGFAAHCSRDDRHEI